MEHQGKTYSDDWDACFDDERGEHVSESRTPAREITATVADSPAPAPARTPAIPIMLSRAVTPPGPIFPRCAHPDHFPALFARSGLFPAERVRRASSAPAAATEIFGQGAYRATLTGPRLSVGDKLVFESIVRLAKAVRLDLHQPLRTSHREIARDMAWKDEGGGTLRFIWAALERFASTEISFSIEDGTRRSGKMLESATKLRGSQGLDLRFDPNFIIGAFSCDKQYRIDRARRESFDSPLSKWLHDFVSTHSKPMPLDLAYLRERSGFHGRPKDFVSRLRLAADTIASKAPGLLASYAIRTGRRSSDNWQIEFTRGIEKASFLLPESANTRRPAL